MLVFADVPNNAIVVSAYASDFFLFNNHVNFVSRIPMRGKEVLHGTKWALRSVRKFFGGPLTMRTKDSTIC